MARVYDGEAQAALDVIAERLDAILARLDRLVELSTSVDLALAPVAKAAEAPGCESNWSGLRCELPRGHDGLHVSGGIGWTVGMGS